MQNRQPLPVLIRPALDSDFDRIWEIFHAVVKSGDTYAYDPASTKEEAKSIWMAPTHRTYVAVVDHRVEGTYFLKTNQPGLGSHVANAGFMVDPDTKAKGIGTQLAQHSMAEAKSLGYFAMQFNFVVSTNVRAVDLWKRLGFSIVGTLPQAFRHNEHGFVDAYVMHQFLT